VFQTDGERQPLQDAPRGLLARLLDVGAGVVGDNYIERGSPQTDDGLAHP